MRMKKIVIASVLKPVDDVRSYWKIAQSLAKTNKYDVNIIGIDAKKQTVPDNIHFHPHSLSRAQWFKRIWTRILIGLKIIHIRPSVVVITTYELIYVSILAKAFIGCHVIYDVQENYSLNVQLSPGFHRKIFAAYIQLKEWIGRQFFNQYWLAEECYLGELKTPSHRTVVIENKANQHKINEERKHGLNVLFTGTISSYSGAMDAMSLMKSLTELSPQLQGLFIGQIHDDALKKWMEQQVQDFPNIQLNMSSNPIPHEEILNKIVWAHLGIISYQENRVNRNKIPTKLYEYSRYRLPYLIQENTKWSKLGIQLGGAIPVDLKSPDWDKIKKYLSNPENLFPDVYPKEACWEFESTKLINSIDTVLT